MFDDGKKRVVDGENEAWGTEVLVLVDGWVVAAKGSNWRICNNAKANTSSASSWSKGPTTATTWVLFALSQHH